MTPKTDTCRANTDAPKKFNFRQRKKIVFLWANLLPIFCFSLFTQLTTQMKVGLNIKLGLFHLRRENFVTKRFLSDQIMNLFYLKEVCPQCFVDNIGLINILRHIKGDLCFCFSTSSNFHHSAKIGHKNSFCGYQFCVRKHLYFRRVTFPTSQWQLISKFQR